MVYQRLVVLLLFVAVCISCNTKKDITLKGESSARVDSNLPSVSVRELSAEEKKKIPGYLSVFYSENKQKWKQAKAELIAMGPIGIEALCVFMIKFFAAGKRGMVKNFSAYWARARKELVEIGEPAVPYIVFAMAHPSMGTTGRMQCSQTLVTIGSPAVDILVKNLETGDRSFRRLNLETLGNIGDAKAAAPIAALYLKLPKPEKEPEDLTADPTFDQRYYCMKALGKIRSQDSLDAIDEALGDPIPLVRQAAIVAAAHFHDKEALPVLQKAAKISKTAYPGHYKILQRQIAIAKGN